MTYYYMPMIKPNKLKHALSLTASFALSPLIAQHRKAKLYLIFVTLHPFLLICLLPSFLSYLNCYQCQIQKEATTKLAIRSRPMNETVSYKTCVVFP